MPYEQAVIKRRKIIAPPESYFSNFPFVQAPNGYITEDASQFYAAEDGTTYYVQEN